MQCHTFDQRSWALIKDFAGIYGIKMDYTKISKLSKKKLSNVYFKVGKLSREPFETSVQYVITYDECGRMQPAASWRGIRNLSQKEWKNLILTRISQGYKNKKLYEAIAKLLN